MHTDEKLNWVEALPRILRIYHDTPGESGLAPFHMLYGRDRNLAGVPYTEPRECESALKFFQRMEEIDKKISEKLNTLHIKENERHNAPLKEPTPFKPGDWVWVLRPRGSNVSKLDTWWVGPVEVVKRVGNLSYQVKIKTGVVQDVHMDQMKPFNWDRLQGPSVPLYHHTTGYQPMATSTDEWEVENILKHRRGKHGQLEFLTKWENSPELTWELVEHFITRYCFQWVKYLQTHQVPCDL